jgi:tetratricopeptide (TPR) repeat protein
MANQPSQTGLTYILIDRIYTGGARWLIMVAILFFSVSFMLIGFFAFSSTVEASFYTTNLEKAFKEGDGKRVELCLDALMALEPDNPSIRLQFAMFLESQKRFPEAAALLDGLASLDDEYQGFDQAHLIIAKRLLAVAKKGSELKPNDYESKNAELKSKAVKHLVRALAGNPKNIEARADLAETLLETGQINEAIPQAIAVVSVRPELCVRLARILVTTQKQKALDLLALAEAPLRSKLKQNPGNEELIRAVADINVLQTKYVEAMDLLSAALAANQSEGLRQDLGSAIAFQMGAILNKPTPDLGEYLALLKKGLDIDPTNPLILQRMEDGLKMGNEAANAINSKLEELLAKGLVPDLVHLLLGTEAHRKSRPDLARVHFELAYQANPKLPNVCNNLAWYLSNESPRDLKRALELSAQAVIMDPSNPQFRETRGQIHVLMGQWKEAVVDLEYALSKLGSMKSIHQGLATSYRQLGDTKLTEIHQGQADKQKDLNLPTVPRIRKTGS